MSQISWNRVQWQSTILLNLLRSVAAGIVWFIIRLLLQDPVADAAVMLLLPVFYFTILLPIGLLAIFLANAGVPFVSLLSMIAAVAIIVGDPPLFLVSLIKPELLPVQGYPLINLNLIVFVQN